MRTRTALQISLLLTITALTISAAAKQGEYVEGTLLAKLKANITLKTDASPFATGNVVLDSLNKTCHCSSLKPLIPPSPRVEAGSSFTRIYVLKFTTSVEIGELVNAYLKTGLFDYVEPDGIIRASTSGTPTGYLPNDQYFKRQWALNNDGSYTGSSVTPKDNADINIPEAWELEQGDTSVIIAILDSGCKTNHPELAGRIWKNLQEIPGNGIDDDGNGFIDDVDGWDFAYDTNNPIDQDGHGTAIAGIIGANTNNTIGFSGVNPNARIMVVKILDADGLGSTGRMVKGIDYAIKMGANIINLSLTGTVDVQTGHDAILAAFNKGITIAAPTGNSNANTISYPAAYPEVIAVGATGPDDKRYSSSTTVGSNFGKEIDIVAPGASIYMLGTQDPDPYSLKGSGTSCATAFISGVASLLLAQNPALTPVQIRDILQKSADDQVGDPKEDVKGWDIYYGWGRLNAYKALLRATAVKHRQHRHTPRAQLPCKFAIINSSIRAAGNVFTLDGRLLNRAIGKMRLKSAVPGVYILSPAEKRYTPESSGGSGTD